MQQPDGRTRHYGEFYGLEPGVPDGRPTWLVWGNCQAEALRVCLDTVTDRPYRTVRVPPVHELTAEDVPQVRRLVSNATLLLTQPVQPGYRDLPIGTADVAALLPAGSTVVRWPVVRYSGLTPFTVIARDPDDPSASPPDVPYHDLRDILQAARPGAGWDFDVPAATLRVVAAMSLAELERREARDCDLAVSDLVTANGAGAMHTLNHPANPILTGLAQRVLGATGMAGPVADPGRDLLAGTRAPIERRVLLALGLDAAAARLDWEHDGARWTVEQVRRSHLSWYADRPALVAAALRRHADLIELVGAGAAAAG